MKHPIQQENLSLRLATPHDFAIIERWLNKEYIKQWYGDPEEWMQEIKNESGEFDWLNHYIVVYENTPIGFCQYYDCDKTPAGFEWDDEVLGTYAIDYLIGQEEYLKKGLGSVIIQTLKQLIIALEHPKQLIADPVPENVDSIRLLLKNGFALNSSTGLYKLAIELGETALEG